MEEMPTDQNVACIKVGTATAFGSAVSTNLTLATNTSYISFSGESGQEGELGSGLYVHDAATKSELCYLSAAAQHHQNSENVTTLSKAFNESCNVSGRSTNDVFIEVRYGPENNENTHSLGLRLYSAYPRDSAAALSCSDYESSDATKCASWGGDCCAVLEWGEEPVCEAGYEAFCGLDEYTLSGQSCCPYSCFVPSGSTPPLLPPLPLSLPLPPSLPSPPPSSQPPPPPSSQCRPHSLCHAPPLAAGTKLVRDWAELLVEIELLQPGDAAAFHLAPGAYTFCQRGLGHRHQPSPVSLFVTRTK